MPFQIMASQSKDKPRDTTLTTVSEIKDNIQTLIINTLIHFVLVILTYSGKNMTDINKVDKGKNITIHGKYILGI